jgi:hypothetical protein
MSREENGRKGHLPEIDENRLEMRTFLTLHLPDDSATIDAPSRNRTSH